LEIENSSFDKQIIVNGLISPDTNVFVNLSYTKAVDDGKDYFISDAKVKLYWQDTSVTLNYLDSGLYISNIKPLVNQVYKLEVVKNDTILSAETIVPDTNFFDTVEVRLYTGTDISMASRYSDVYVKIKDNPRSEDYYEVFFPNVFCTRCQYFLDMDDYNAFIADVNDPFLIAEGYIPGESYSSVLFSDQNFDSDSVTLHLHVDLGEEYRISNDTIYYLATVVLVVRKVSEEYYKYRKSYDIYFSNRNNNSFNSFANMSFIPKFINVYGNIKGGYGIFAGYSQIFRRIDIEEIHLLHR